MVIMVEVLFFVLYKMNEVCIFFVDAVCIMYLEFIIFILCDVM